MDPRPEILNTPLVEHGGRFAALKPETGSGIVDFSVCLNAYGSAPVVTDAIRASAIDEYPDRYCKAPRHAAAYRWDRLVEEIVFGAGAAELIQAVCFAYLRRGDSVVISEPCFGEYARASALCGAQIHRASAPLGNDEPALWDGVMNTVRLLVQKQARMVFLASPTSPAGAQYPLPMLQIVADACARSDCLLILDQSYDAFLANPAGTPAMPGHSHAVHVRSLTKEHALAGVRAAFAVTTPAIAAFIERARVPWSSTTAAQAAAVAGMTDAGLQHVRDCTERLRSAAAHIASRCAERGVRTVPSSTHYMLIECENATRVRERMVSEFGILVRDCSSFGLPQHIRIAARTSSDNSRLLEAIDTLADEEFLRTSGRPTSRLPNTHG